MEPASSVIGILGGPAKVSRLLSIHPVTVSKWKRPREVGGTGGRIPQRHWPALLCAAKESGLDLNIDALYAGEQAA